MIPWALNIAQGVSRKQEITRNERDKTQVASQCPAPESLCHYIGRCQTRGHQPRMSRPSPVSLDRDPAPPLQLSLNFTTINPERPGRQDRQWEWQLGLIITPLTNLDLIISWEWGWHFQRLLEIRLSPDHENWIPILVFLWPTQHCLYHDNTFGFGAKSNYKYLLDSKFYQLCKSIYQKQMVLIWIYIKYFW